MVEREQKQLQLLLLIQHLSEQKRKISETMLPQLLQRLEQSADSAFDWAKSNGLLTESDVRKLDQQFRDVCADQSSSLHEATEQLLSGSPELQASHRLLASEAATADPMATEYESKPPESLVPTPNVDDGTEVEAAPSPDPNATADHTDADSPARGSTRVQSSGGVEEAKELSDPDQTHHRFRPLRFHARGGLGEIHIAQDEELNREVALKEIRPQYVDDQPSRDRFVMEGEVTGRLEHPGVVPVYGMGADASGRPFYAMRFIKGESLSDAIERFHGSKSGKSNEVALRSRSIETQTLLRRFMSVCQTMDYAHSRGVLHRDLKPDNVMLGRYDETLIVDWGLAKIIGRSKPSEEATSTQVETTLHPEKLSDPNKTARGSIAGTLLYMSPEQAMGWHDRLEPAADVFSLGAILFELLTGKRLYDARTVDEAQKLAVACKPRSPADVMPSVPKPLAAICLKATAKETEDRYASAGALAEDIAAFLADQPVTAKQDTLLERAGRWARRNRTIVSTATAAGLVALIALGTASLLLSSKNREIATKNEEVTEQRDQAEKNLTLARSAVRDLLSSLSKDTRLKEAGLDRLRLELAKDAAPYFEEFLTSTPNNEAIALEQSQLNTTLGEISFQASSQEDALGYYEAICGASHDLMENAEDAKQVLFRRILALAHYRMGYIRKEWGELELAEENYEKAIEVAQLLPDEPLNAEDEAMATLYGSRAQLQAASMMGLSQADIKMGRLQSAEQRVAESMELLGGDSATISRYSLNARRILAQIARLRGQGPEAEEQLRQVVADASKLPNRSEFGSAGATEAERRSFKVEVWNELGTHIVAQGQPLAGLEVFELALTLAEETKQLFPENMYAEELLGMTLNNLTVPSHQLVNRQTDFEEFQRRQRELLDESTRSGEQLLAINPKVYETRINQLISRKNTGHELTNSGKPLEALEILEQVERDLLVLRDRLPEYWEVRNQLAWNSLFMADAISFDRTKWDQATEKIVQAVESAESEFERTGITEFLFTAQAGYLRRAQLASNAIFPDWDEVIQHNESRLRIFALNPNPQGPGWRVVKSGTYKFLADAYYAQGDNVAAAEAIGKAIETLDGAIDQADREPTLKMERFLAGVYRVNLEMEDSNAAPLDMALELSDEAKLLEDVDPKWIRSDIFETLIETFETMAREAGKAERYLQQQEKLQLCVGMLDELYLRNKDRRDLLRKAELQMELAMATFGVGDEAGFLQTLENARETARAYLSLQSRSQKARSVLALSFIRAGEFYTLSESYEEAFRQYDQAVEAESKEYFNKSRIYRAKATAHLGNYLSSIDDVRRIESLDQLTADELFDASAVYALSLVKLSQEEAAETEEDPFLQSLRQRLVTDAIARMEECLKKSKKAGTTQEYLDFAEESSDFAVLKSTDEFKALVSAYE